MKKPFSTIRYMSTCEISQEDITTLTNYKNNLIRICNWSGSRREIDINSTLHFKIELKRINKLLNELKPIKYEEIENINDITIGDISKLMV